MKKKDIILSFIFLFCFCIYNIQAQNSHQESKEITALIKKKREYNKNYGTGFRIQLYNGLEKRAKSLRNKFKIEYPGIYTKIEYKEPDWKIQVGNYKTKLEADRALNEIREKFNGAIVVPL